MRIIDWSSDVCSSDLLVTGFHVALEFGQILLEDPKTLLQCFGELLFLTFEHALDVGLLGFEFRESLTHFGHQGRNDLIEETALGAQLVAVTAGATNDPTQHIATTFVGRSEEHTSELQSLMRNSYAVFCLQKKQVQKQIEIAQV